MTPIQDSSEIKRSPGLVELWTSRRLPFEPRGALRTARDDLRWALGELRRPPSQRLVAEYVSEAEEFFDVENVLLYNVGTAAFSGLDDRGLRLVRTRAKPPKPASGQEFRHYHRYSFEPIPSPPEFEPLLVIPPIAINSSTPAHMVWWNAASAKSTVAGHSDPIVGPFKLTIFMPQQASHIAGITKPLVDGIVASLHQCAGIDEEAVRRLSVRTGWDSAEIDGRLRNPAVRLLEPRTVLRRYRNFVKWDPADDRCEEIEIVADESVQGCLVWVTPL